MRTLTIIVAVLALGFAACTRNTFVQAGRTTILAVEEGVSAVDEVAVEHYADAPDTPEVDAEIDRWVCVLRTIDSSLLAGWKILALVEDGPPKLRATDASKWYTWAFELMGELALVESMLQLHGIAAEGLSTALDFLAEFVPRPDPDDPPMDLDCSEVLP